MFYLAQGVHSECEYTLCPPGPRRVWWCHSAPSELTLPIAPGVPESPGVPDPPGVPAAPEVLAAPGSPEGPAALPPAPLGSLAPHDLQIAHSAQCHRPGNIDY